MATGAQVVAEARTWLRTPFQHQASLKGVGTDCIGFIAGVALACGLPDAAAFKNDPEFRGYGRTPDAELLERGCAAYLERIAFADAQPGDVLRMRMDNDPRHFVFVSRLNPIYILHAYSMQSAKLSRVVEHGLGPVWRARVDQAYRFRGIE
jgi:NlpC/P60 family putative phage cell wall peptidase